MTKIINLTLMLLLATILLTQPAIAANMTLDGMTGGMAGDSNELLNEILFWVVTMALVVCVIVVAFGVISSNPDATKKGAYGLLSIIAIVLFYYCAMFAIAFLKSTYGS